MTGLRVVEAAYYLFVLLIPIESITLNGAESGFSFSKALGLLLFGFALVNWRSCFRKLPPAFWMVAWYVAVYALSQLWIPGALDEKFRENQATLLQMAALFLISANLFRDARFRGAVLRFYGWLIALIAVGMLLGVAGERLVLVEGRSTVLGQDPNSAAGLFALGAVCLAGDPRRLGSGRFPPSRLPSLLAVSALILAVIQTGSRGGLIDVVAGIAGLALCGGKASRRRRVLISGAVIGVLGLLVLREFQQGTVASSRLIDAWLYGDTAGRTPIYHEAWSMFLERPLLGYGGANNFSTLGARLNFAPGRAFYRDTHNLPLAVLTEVGLVGGLPFLAAIACALWKAWRYGRRADDPTPFALMLALGAINSSLTWNHQKIAWIILAAAVSCGWESDSAEKQEARSAPADFEPVSL